MLIPCVSKMWGTWSTWIWWADVWSIIKVTTDIKSNDNDKRVALSGSRDFKWLIMIATLFNYRVGIDIINETDKVLTIITTLGFLQSHLNRNMWRKWLQFTFNCGW